MRAASVHGKGSLGGGATYGAAHTQAASPCNSPPAAKDTTTPRRHARPASALGLDCATYYISGLTNKTALWDMQEAFEAYSTMW